MKEKEPSAAEIALSGSLNEKLVQAATPKFQFLDERHIFEDTPVFLQILTMEKSYFVWVGSIPPTMNLLQLTVPTALVRYLTDYLHELNSKRLFYTDFYTLKDTEPVSTSLFGSKGVTVGSSISAKLGMSATINHISILPHFLTGPVLYPFWAMGLLFDHFSFE